MKAMDGKGQARPLLVQIKILPVGESVPKDRCCWVTEKRTRPCPTHRTSPGEVCGLENREGLCTHSLGVARDRPHQAHDCQGCVNCGVTERIKL